MWLLMIEGLVAFFLLAFIVWWTMYSGRKPDRPAPLDSLPKPQDKSGTNDRIE